MLGYFKAGTGWDMLRGHVAGRSSIKCVLHCTHVAGTVRKPMHTKRIEA